MEVIKAKLTSSLTRLGPRALLRPFFPASDKNHIKCCCFSKSMLSRDEINKLRFVSGGRGREPHPGFTHSCAAIHIGTIKRTCRHSHIRSLARFDSMREFYCFSLQLFRKVPFCRLRRASDGCGGWRTPGGGRRARREMGKAFGLNRATFCRSVLSSASFWLRLLLLYCAENPKIDKIPVNMSMRC
jgi:hypothetical protein